MKINKPLLTCLFCFMTFTVFAQDWSKDAHIDTIRHDSARIRSIINWDSNESIEFYYDSKGKLKQRSYVTWKNGIQYEMIKEYYPNGVVKYDYYLYVLDKKLYGKSVLDSTYLTYYEDGSIKIRQFFIKGKENGKTISYYPNGQAAKEEDCVDGRLMNVRYFDKNGIRLETGDFKDGNGNLFMYCDGNRIGVCKFRNGKSKSCKSIPGAVDCSGKKSSG